MSTASGRVQHDEKITVYLTGGELCGLEQARIDLFATHDLRVDRGRLVRLAIARLLADLQAGDITEIVTPLLPEQVTA